MSEKEIVLLLREYLTFAGFQIVKPKTDRFKHADIVASDSNGNRLIFEAKGYLPKSVRGDFLEGVGQLIQRVTNNMDEHYLVLPDTPRHRNQARNIHLFVRKALKIGFFFANDNGQLRKYRASEKVDAKEGGTLIYASNLH